MSSDEFQIIRINQRTREINPRQNTSKIIKNKTSYQKVSSTRGGDLVQSKLSQPVSTFVSRRELNQSSPVYTGGKNQLPVRTNVLNPEKSNQIKYKYEPNKTSINNQNQKKQISLDKAQNKNIIQKYNTNYQKKYDSSGSASNIRQTPMTFNSNRNINFNIKKWAYVSKQVINKIIIIQRWWRYLLTNYIYRKGRFNRNNAKSAVIRSKSSMTPTCEFLKDFIKQGENITEKVYPGKNNKLVVETRKVEVFKNMKPKSLNKIKVKKTGENITEKIYQTRNNKLINERRTVEVFQINKPQIPKDIKLFNTESGEFALRIQKSKKYIDKEKTEKEKETIINERRKGENFKIRDQRKKDELQINKKEEKIYSKGQYQSSKNYQIQSQRITGQISSKKRFKEENGINKTYIKEKMIEIWLDETSKRSVNSFTLYGEINQNKFTTLETINTLSSSRRLGQEKNDNKKSEINNLLKIIKDKDNELNKIANQLKDEMNKIKIGSYTPKMQITTIKNNYSLNTSSNLSRNNLTLETKIQQLLIKIKEKDEQINNLLNKIKTQSSKNINIYNEYEQKANSRFSGNQRDKSADSYAKINKTYIKNNYYDSINRINNTEEYDTLNTQNTQNTINVENYENRITELETIIKEKDTELENISSQLDTIIIILYKYNLYIKL